MSVKIKLTKPYFDGEEIENIKNVLDSGFVAGFGPNCDILSKKIQNFCSVNYAVCVNNCTAALHASLLALGIEKDDEVIISDLTFPATGNAVLAVNAKPVFADVDKRTYNILPDKIEEKITSNTKAIIPVHNFGQCSEMDKIMKIAKKNKDKENEKKGTGLKKEQGEENTGQGKGREEKCVIFFRTILA